MFDEAFNTPPENVAHPNEVAVSAPETTYVSTLLYHGTKEPFHFRTDYTFNDPSNDGSFTLGTGIYLTNSLEHAADYSWVRKSRREGPAIIFSVAAEQCKFLDFRGEEGNVPVTVEMIVKWKDYFEQDLKRQKQEKPDLGPERIEVDFPHSPNITKRIKINWEVVTRKNLDAYLSYLQELLTSPRRVDLRELLGTAPVPWTKTQFEGNETAPLWSNLFRSFVVQELEHDGIIYLEAAEGNLKELYPSFVVYNLESIHFSDKPLSPHESRLT